MMRIMLMLCTTNATDAPQFRRDLKIAGPVNPAAPDVSAMELLQALRVMADRARFGSATSRLQGIA
jgi:hypothetical protein